MIRPFDKVIRERYREYREGPILIHISSWKVVVALTVLTIGIMVRGISDKHSNKTKFLEDQGCPALNGQFFQWVTDVGNLLIAIGFLGLSFAGILPYMLKLCQLRDEAICCGQIFMGYIGKFLVFMALFGLTLFNIYGSFILK